MLSVQLPSEAIELGEVLVIRLAAEDDSVEHRAFVQYGSLVYPQPVRPWSREREMSVFPEAPGQYRLLIDWRDGDGQIGRVVQGFEVKGRGESSTLPGEEVVVQTRSGATLVAPSEWEAAVYRLSRDDLDVCLASLLPSSRAFYDIGASIGRFAVEAGKVLANCGQVVAIEANPACVDVLRRNIERNELTNVTLLPVALLDERGLVGFRLIYGNFNLGLTDLSDFFAYKIGHQVAVPCWSLDELVEELSLPSPDLIKIDVEGVEAAVVRGMRRILLANRPILALELHGLKCARQVMTELATFDYHFLPPGLTGEPREGDWFLDRWENKVQHVVAIPRGLRGTRGLPAE